MNCPYKASGNDGFTLVELLVTILIIVILSVTMLPLLKPFVTQAQYSAEGVPVIGNIRTKVELFRIENDRLPGVPVDALGDVVNVNGKSYSTSDLSGADDASNISEPNEIDENTSGHQGLVYDEVSGTYQYTLNYLMDENGVTPGLIADTSDAIGMHVWSRIGVNYSDLLGKKLRPQHIQYVVLKSAGDSYCWIVSCFGDGSGLAAGCGYAVAEYNNPKLQKKFVATFELYKPVNSSVQLVVSPSTQEPSPSSTDPYLSDGKVYFPALAAIEGAANDNAAMVDDAIGQLRKWGWQVN